MGSEAQIRQSFLQQAQSCSDLGSPFNALLCTILGERLDRSSAFGRRVLDWDGERLVGDAVALRCCGALHAQVRSGQAPALAKLYPPGPLPDGRAFFGAVAQTIDEHDQELTRFLDSPPQTNEVARSALLLGGFLHIAHETGLPLSLFEIGASAGLNLLFDRYAYELGSASWGKPDAPLTIACAWRGRLPPFDAPLRIAGRVGCDANPLDPTKSADRERLMAYIWPDQAIRLACTQAALAIAAQAGTPVERGDAPQWAAERLSAPGEPGSVRVLYHSIVWQYLRVEARARLRNTIRDRAASARPDAPFAWLSIEPEDGDAAVMRLTIWPEGTTRRLARCDYHGRWAEWL